MTLLRATTLILSALAFVVCAAMGRPRRAGSVPGGEELAVPPDLAADAPVPGPSPKARPARRRLASAGLSVLFVLACGAVGFVLRGVVAPGDPAPKPGVALRVAGLPASAPAESDTFSLDAARNRAIPPGASLIASAKRGAIRVFRKPGKGRGRPLRRRVFNKQRIPLVFMAVDQRTGWVKVQLPTRPTGSTGWVRRRAVRLSYTRLNVRVSLRRRVVEVFEGRKLLKRTRVGIGTSVTPTPKGRYYVTDVVRAPNPKGFYGPYAIGLSAHSRVVTSFRGGTGQIGLHGTNAPEGLGTTVSMGCIRMSNAVIRALAKRIPLGTPVTIV